MIRNLQVLAIALLVSSVSLAFGQAKEADNAVVGKSVVGDDGSKKAASSAATPKKKPGKDAKVYVGKSQVLTTRPPSSSSSSSLSSSIRSCSDLYIGSD